MNNRNLAEDAQRLRSEIRKSGKGGQIFEAELGEMSILSWFKVRTSVYE